MNAQKPLAIAFRSEQTAVIAGIWGDHDPFDPDGRGDRIARTAFGGFPAYLVAAGFHMEPREVFREAEARPKEGSSRCYRFVLPRDWGLDLGTLRLSPQTERKTPLIAAFMRGYDGADIRGWLLRNTEAVLAHLSRLESEWKAPPVAPETACYGFEKALHRFERNLALVFGQLERFGGDQVLVALKLCGGDAYLRLLGYNRR
jgi:hypothetical protein